MSAFTFGHSSQWVHLPAEVAPEHLGRVEPRAVGRQVEQHQPTRRPTQHRLDLVVLLLSRALRVVRYNSSSAASCSELRADLFVLSAWSAQCRCDKLAGFCNRTKFY